MCYHITLVEELKVNIKLSNNLLGIGENKHNTKHIELKNIQPPKEIEYKKVETYQMFFFLNKNPVYKPVYYICFIH